jgi:hypothetical protein
VRAAALAMIAAAVLAAQNQVATQDLWTLDIATNQIRVFHGSGEPTGTTIALVGSGSARSLAFAESGLAYVCRGQEVRTYDGTTSGLFAGTTQGIDQPQHVAVRPGAAQEVWIACGATTSNSKIIHFSSTGTSVQTYTNAMMDHPRRIAWNQAGDKLFIASVGNKKILTLDPATGTFAQLADLTSQNISPIGLSFDVTRNAVWTVGDFGFNGHIGFVDVMTGAYTNVINESQYPGMHAPAGIFFDRFRTLTVANRNLNGGIAGLYRFSAQTGTALADLGPITAGFTSLIDAAGRPEIIGIGAPVSGNAFVLNASMSQSVANAITFNVPRVPNQAYAAALSPRWQPQCAPYIPGIIDPGLRLQPPDPRGIPLSLSDGGFLIMQSAAICCAPGTPAPLNTVLTIDGFAGFLSATGTANATITFHPVVLPINAFELSLTFITVDLAVFNRFGRMSDPICLTVNVGP